MYGAFVSYSSLNAWNVEKLIHSKPRGHSDKLEVPSMVGARGGAPKVCPPYVSAPPPPQKKNNPYPSLSGYRCMLLYVYVKTAASQPLV